jgi:DNA repair exonuclease SbcCD nuclease subunit
MVNYVFNKVLFTSDLHLSDTIWKHRPIYGDSYESWNYIVEYALSNKVDAVILAGDLLDKQLNLAGPVYNLAKGIAALTNNNITVLYNQGQHEFQLETHWAQLGNVNGNVFHLNLEAPVFDCKFSNGLQIAGFDYCNAKTLAEKLEFVAKSPGEFLLVCHQVWKDFMGDLGNPQGCFDDVPANVRYLLTGDYHDHICKYHGENKLTVLSPGSTHMRSLSEPPNKYFFVAESDAKDSDSRKLKITSIPIPTRSYYDFNTKHPSTLTPLKLEKAIAKVLAQPISLAEELKKPLIKIVHKPEDNELVNRIKEKYSNDAYLFFKLEGLAVTNLADDKTADTAKLTLMECLDDEVDKIKEPAAYELASRLLSGGDPSIILATWLEEKLNAD